MERNPLTTVGFGWGPGRATNSGQTTKRHFTFLAEVNPLTGNWSGTERGIGTPAKTVLATSIKGNDGKTPSPDCNLVHPKLSQVFWSGNKAGKQLFRSGFLHLPVELWLQWEKPLLRIWYFGMSASSLGKCRGAKKTLKKNRDQLSGFSFEKKAQLLIFIWTEGALHYRLVDHCKMSCYCKWSAGNQGKSISRVVQNWWFFSIVIYILLSSELHFRVFFFLIKLNFMAGFSSENIWILKLESTLWSETD